MPHRPLHHRLVLAAGLCAGLVACAAGEADAHPPYGAYPPPAYDLPPQSDLLSVSLESAQGWPLPATWSGGAVYVAGEPGMAYRIRLTNRSPERIEAVVSVDGRDVVSGRLADYRSQRGYVLGPYESITIDGFRQSLDHVATFRFSSVQDAYSARMGTPQHVGVIGVAVFRERTRTRPRPRPLAAGDRRYRSAAGSAGAPRPAEAADAAASGRTRRARSANAAPRALEGGFAPPPVPRNEIGTAYGETRASHVVETTFRRRHRRRPDHLITLYYDTPEGLAARGIYLAPPAPPPPPTPSPDPWPRDTRFAPPPPPPRY